MLDPLGHVVNRRDVLPLRLDAMGTNPPVPGLGGDHVTAHARDLRCFQVASLDRREGRAVQPVPPMEPGSGDGYGSRSVGNPGDTPHLVDEMDPPRSVGNPGETPDPVAEYDAPRSVGNPGETPDPLAEYDPPRSIGDPGSND